MLNKLLLMTTFFTLFIGPVIQAEEMVIQQTLTPKLCQQFMTDHVTSMGTAYQPEIDSEGNTITPADLKNSMTVKLPEKITISLRLNVQKFLNVPTETTSLLKQQADLGSITLHQDGRLYYDDQLLFEKDQQTIKQACQKLMSEDK